VSGLAAELQLLSSAQTALRDGRSAAALELLERYDRMFPSGQLQGERLAAEVFAGCQSGNRARAVRAAERFLQRDDSSVLAERVRRSCAFDDGGQRR
jgi:outer membrane protein assembly factor BamD (BamD/ComL family)